MALSDLKRVEKEKPVPVVKSDLDPILQAYALDNALGFNGETLKFDYKGKRLIVRGIPEDYKVKLDDELVFECVYETLYHINGALVHEIMS